MNLSAPFIKCLPLSFQVGKEATKITVEVQKSSASWDTGGSALEEGTEKPETELGCLSPQTEAVHQEQQPAAAERYALSCFWTFIGPDSYLWQKSSGAPTNSKQFSKLTSDIIRHCIQLSSRVHFIVAVTSPEKV